MKPFVFDQQEYHDLDSLGIAFSNHFDLALKTIQEKNFVKFIKKFKTHKQSIKRILFQSRYLQNALSMLIYVMTDEHILYLGHKRYYTIQGCLEDINKNSAILYFAIDHGFTNTIWNTIEDEKLKLDLKAFEDNPKDGLALSYIEKYYKLDSIDSIEFSTKTTLLSKDPFKTAVQEFKSEQVQLSLAKKYSLKEVMDLRKKNSPVFKGLSLIHTENEHVIEILETGFYLSLMDTWKKAKYKGKSARLLKKKIKSCIKAYKKYQKMGVQQKIIWHESLHTLYLEWIDYFKLEKIILKDSMDEPTVPYCDTYISPFVQQQNSLERDKFEKPYESILKPIYDLRQLNISFRNHSFFVYWSLLFVILQIPVFLVLCLIPDMKENLFSLLTEIFQLEGSLDSFMDVTMVSLYIQILFYVGIGITFVFGIVILLFKYIARRRYNALCRLSFYRKNEMILRDKEVEDYEKIRKMEAKYAKSIDRFYRFYGGISMAGQSLAIVIVLLIVINFFAYFIYDSLSIGIHGLFIDKSYFIAIPPVLCMLCGFARHKKTAWSAIFTYGISIILALVLAYVSMLI